MTVPEQIAALATKTTAELAADYEALFGRPARYRSPTWMRKRLAFKLQENALGGLTRKARAALAELQADIQLPTAPRAEPERPRGELRVGSVLRREWRGQQIRVEVVADGIVWNGTTYGSLSAVAFAITGARWNGKLFFNLVGRRTKA
jgi:hypothetical protein